MAKRAEIYLNLTLSSSAETAPNLTSNLALLKFRRRFCKQGKNAKKSPVNFSNRKNLDIRRLFLAFGHK